ncbi:MAG TPA: putative 2OG-Fe(II) oxygenase, partial [Thermoanaerobaculia bacterium]
VRRTVRDPEPRHLADWSIGAWANVNRKGHSNQTHRHLGPHSLWSGIYYVSADDIALDGAVTGCTVFEDRSLVPKEILRNPDPFERQHVVRPRNGLLVIFPAGLYHAVEPYSGDGARITLAFNLWNPAFTVPMYSGLEELDWWWAKDIELPGAATAPPSFPPPMSGTEALIARNFPDSSRELAVGGVPSGELAATFGTPLFVYAADVLDRQWTLLRRTFPAIFSLAYAVQANPNLSLLRWFVNRGAELAVASPGELQLALLAGALPSSLLLTGPGKTDAELESALEQGIGKIHVGSAAEAERLAALAHRRETRVPIILQVNPRADVKGGIAGGKPAPFGIDEEELGAIVPRLSANLELIGIRLLATPQTLDAGALLRGYDHGMRLGESVAELLGYPLRRLDFGHGPSIPCFSDERPVDMARLAEGLDSFAARCATAPMLAGARFTVEAGRFLVGEAGVYLTRVIETKISRDKRFYVVDGGMHHHLAASGNLGQVIKRNFPIVVANRLDVSARIPANVVGSLGTPLDVLAREAALPPAQAGDLIAILQSGAFGRAASPLGFLSHPAPPEVFVEGARPRLIRRRGTGEDLLCDLIENRD